MKKRIIVVEDHAALRQGITETIDRECDLAVCGQADDVSSALAVVDTAGADLVLIDLQLRASSGIDLIRQLRQRHPALPVVAMTIFNQERFEKLARAAGASGFAGKQEGPVRLLEVIRQALLSRHPAGHPPQRASGAAPTKVETVKKPNSMNNLSLDPTKIASTAPALAELKQHIRTLITLEATDAPVISFYLNLESAAQGSGDTDYKSVLSERAALLRKSLNGERRKHLDDALGRIGDYLLSALQPDSQGAAIFARGGAKPFFLALQFQVPLPNWIAVDTMPNVYHLVELKDTYHRFVLLLMTEKSARILEINLGAVTEEAWAERPELRDRMVSGWSKAHYQHHREQQTEQFIAEEIQVLDRLISAGGHTHLILAGNPAMTARMRKALPKHLAEKLVDTVHASTHDTLRDIVAATNSLFVEHEETESLDRVGQLEQEINTHGLAVAGTAASLRALKCRQADVLVVAKAYQPEPGWACVNCGEIVTAQEKPMTCAVCQGLDLREVDLREEMVQLAEQSGSEVEIVAHSELLMELGGVGCLLRYQTPERRGR